MDGTALSEVKVLSEKKVIIVTVCGAIHQRRLKDGRFIYADHVYEIRHGDAVRVA